MYAGEQVLICPTCQQDASWQDGLDRCPACDGVRLTKMMGWVRCSACGWAEEASRAPEVQAPVQVSAQELAADDQLAADVSAALSRVLGEPGPSGQ